MVAGAGGMLLIIIGGQWLFGFATNRFQNRSHQYVPLGISNSQRSLLPLKRL